MSPALIIINFIYILAFQLWTNKKSDVVSEVLVTYLNEKSYYLSLSSEV